METLVNSNAVTTNVVLNDVPVIQVNDVATNAVKELTNMEAKRINWEQGAQKTSNQALYNLLAECLMFGGELSTAQAKQRVLALESFYKARGYQYRKDTPLLSRIVRAVFGNIDRRQVSTYSLVLRQAQKSNVAYADLATWIESHGGVQEIRLARSPSFIPAATKVTTAKSDFALAETLAVAKSEQLSLLADAEYVGDNCVLIAEQQADGGFAIKALVRNGGALNAAFMGLYADSKKTKEEVKQEKQAANDADGVALAA